MANIRELRLERKLTQRELGEKVGLSHSMISKLESGTTSLTEDTAERLNNYLKTDIQPKKLKAVGEEYDKPKKSYVRENIKLKEENAKLKKENAELIKKLNSVKSFLNTEV